jgi:hypothetical protein
LGNFLPASVLVFVCFSLIQGGVVGRYFGYSLLLYYGFSNGVMCLFRLLDVELPVDPCLNLFRRLVFEKGTNFNA